MCEPGSICSAAPRPFLSPDSTKPNEAILKSMSIGLPPTLTDAAEQEAARAVLKAMQDKSEEVLKNVKGEVARVLDQKVRRREITATQKTKIIKDLFLPDGNTPSYYDQVEAILMQQVCISGQKKRPFLSPDSTKPNPAILARMSQDLPASLTDAAEQEAARAVLKAMQDKSEEALKKVKKEVTRVLDQKVRRREITATQKTKIIKDLFLPDGNTPSYYDQVEARLMKQECLAFAPTIINVDPGSLQLDPNKEVNEAIIVITGTNFFAGTTQLEFRLNHNPDATIPYEIVSIEPDKITVKLNIEKSQIPNIPVDNPSTSAVENHRGVRVYHADLEATKPDSLAIVGPAQQQGLITVTAIPSSAHPGDKVLLTIKSEDARLFDAVKIVVPDISDIGEIAIAPIGNFARVNGEIYSQSFTIPEDAETKPYVFILLDENNQEIAGFNFRVRTPGKTGYESFVSTLRENNISLGLEAGHLFAPTAEGLSHYWKPVYPHLQPTLRAGIYAGNRNDIDPTNDYASLAGGAKPAFGKPYTPIEFMARAHGVYEGSHINDSSNRVSFGGGLNFRFRPGTGKYFFFDLGTDINIARNDYDNPNLDYPSAVRIDYPMPRLSLGSNIGRDDVTAMINFSYFQSSLDYGDQASAWGFPFEATERGLTLGTSGKVELSKALKPAQGSANWAPDVSWNMNFVLPGISKVEVPVSEPGTIDLASGSTTPLVPSGVATENLAGTLDMGLLLRFNVSDSIKFDVEGRYAQRDQGNWPLRQRGGATLGIEPGDIGRITAGIDYGLPFLRYGESESYFQVPITYRIGGFGGAIPEPIADIFTVGVAPGTVNGEAAASIFFGVEYPGPGPSED